MIDYSAAIIILLVWLPFTAIIVCKSCSYRPALPRIGNRAQQCVAYGGKKCNHHVIRRYHQCAMLVANGTSLMKQGRTCGFGCFSRSSLSCFFPFQGRQRCRSSARMLACTRLARRTPLVFNLAFNCHYYTLFLFSRTDHGSHCSFLCMVFYRWNFRFDDGLHESVTFLPACEKHQEFICGERSQDWPQAIALCHLVSEQGEGSLCWMILRVARDKSKSIITSGAHRGRL